MNKQRTITMGVRATKAILSVIILSVVGYALYWLGGLSILAGLLFGLLGIPVLILLLGDIMPNVVGTIHGILGNVTNNGSAFVYDTQDSQIVPYDKTNNQLFVNNQWQRAKKNPYVSKLWLRPFAITYSQNVFEKYKVNKEELPKEAPALLDEERGGYRAYTPFSKEIEDTVVHAARYMKDIGRQGHRLYNRSESEAMKRFSGSDKMKQLWMIVLMMVNFAGMFTLTYILLGL